MSRIFSKLGLAITFSPTGKALLKEVRRLQKLFNAELVLIHVGERNAENEEKLKTLITQAEINIQALTIIWTSGDPGNAIIKSSRESGVDLLIAGALEKENFMKYYIGSVARKIMREASTSTLILTSPSEQAPSFKKFYVTTDYENADEKTLTKSFQFALLEDAEEFVVVRDFNYPGLASTIIGSGSAEETRQVRESWITEEEDRMKLYLRELELTGMPIKIKCLYGKEGWEAGNYARQNNADLFAVSGPVKKLKFMDRLFHNEIEYLFENLPANLLIIR